MIKHRTIHDVIRLADRFYREENVTFAYLLIESGYPTMHDQISQAEIAEGLSQHLECVEPWLRWSEDKRSSSGWYLRETDRSRYAVGRMSPQESTQPTVYVDRVEACAAFIKRELDDIVTLLKE